MSVTDIGSGIQTKSFLAGNYARQQVGFVSGEGCYLLGTDGKKYLDFLSGIAVTSFGHNHPVITAAAERQLHKVWHTSNLFTVPMQELVAAKLLQHCNGTSVFFCNSGTEANEAAIKYARKWGAGKRFEIVTLNGSFHGRTLGSLTATGQPKLQEGFAPLPAGFIYTDINDAEQLFNSITPETVAVMIEPVQGENGIIPITREYAEALNKVCSENNLLLIADEVQCGMGRTGSFYASEQYGLDPDMITLAKGIANGLPLGAVIFSERVTNIIQPGSHGSTFGGNPVALAAADAVCELLTQKQLKQITAAGELLNEELSALNSEMIKDIRVSGLMAGIELIPELEAKKLSAALMSKGIVTGTAGNNTLRVLPPYIITHTEIKQFTEALATALGEFEQPVNRRTEETIAG